MIDGQSRWRVCVFFKVEKKLGDGRKRKRCRQKRTTAVCWNQSCAAGLAALMARFLRRLLEMFGAVSVFWFLLLFFLAQAISQVESIKMNAPSRARTR